MSQIAPCGQLAEHVDSVISATAATQDPCVAVLVQRAAAGEQAAWDQLVTTYSPLLWGIARGYRLSASDAADAVQTTWLRLVEHLADIQRPEAVGAWLATTLRRECIRMWKRSDRQSPTDIAAMEISDESAGVEPQIMRQEDKAALIRAMQLLSDRQRVLLRMLAITPPPSYEEVAATLGIPVGSIGPTKGRALRRLRRLLDSGHAD